MTSDKSVQCCSEKVRWLKNCGDDNPFPPFLLQTIKTSQSLSSWPAAAFWRQIERREIALFCTSQNGSEKCSDKLKVSGEDESGVLDDVLHVLDDCKDCRQLQLTIVHKHLLRGFGG